MLHLVLLVVSAGAIYLSCELFLNGIEHLGRLLRVGTLAVGSVLAAVGTALPESVVTGIAVTGPDTKDLGVGAALGGPLALGTVAYAVVGLALLARRRSLPGLDSRLFRDQGAFLVVFLAALALGLVTWSWKPWWGLLFFALYGAYVLVELRAPAGAEDDALEPLRLGRSLNPGWGAVLVQVAAMLAVVFAASQVFVRQLEWAGPQLGLSATVTALLLAPLATELPEVMNALIWVRQGKTQLALSNVAGSMMVQGTVPAGLGLLFTPWAFDRPLLLSAIVTACSVAFLLVALRRWPRPGVLAAGAAFYAVFALLLALS